MSSRVRASVSRNIVLVPVLCLFLGVSAQAQQSSPPSSNDNPSLWSHAGIKSLFKDIVSDFGHLPSMSNLGMTIVGGGLALGAHQVDLDVNRHLYGKGGVHDFFLPGKILGQSPFQIGAAVVTYAIGRAGDRPRVEHIGFDLLRAQAVDGVLTLVLKEAVRRERPDGTGKGSFPSGHASVTFATATVLVRHFGWRAAVPGYLVASYVAASRLHENRHFLSDVVAGATVGYISGRTVTRHGRSTFTMIPEIDHRGGALLFARVW